MNKYEITFTDSKGDGVRIFLFAVSEEHALETFHYGFGEHPEARVKFVREAYEGELEEINNTGGPSPRKRR